VPLLDIVAVGGGFEIDTEFVCVVVSVAELVPLKVFLPEKLCETEAVAVFVADEEPVILTETMLLRELCLLNEYEGEAEDVLETAGLRDIELVAVLVFDTRELRLIVRETTADLVNQDLELVGDLVELAVTELAKDAEIECVGLAVQVLKADPETLDVPL
jgi:hypothetical protein